MEISHVIRGEEWINSTPKHKLLYEYFGWEAPEFCHLPLLRNADKSKLSKRKNPTGIRFYQRMGFLPQAVLNYLGTMGWSFPDGRDRFSLSEMIECFDIDRISMGGPVFDLEKLRWLNGCYIREDLSVEGFAEALKQWSFSEPYVMAVLGQVQSRVEVLSDIADKAQFFFSGMPTITAEDLSFKQLSPEETGELLQLSLWALERITEWEKKQIHHVFSRLAEVFEVKMKVFMAPIFVAVAGSTVAPPIMDAMVTLGPDMSRARLRQALKLLGMPSKKQTKAWQKRFEMLDLSMPSE
jgi:glutamyl-tRNA synthetase